MAVVSMRHHIHLKTCIEGIHCCLFFISCQSLIFQLLDCSPIGNDKAIVSPTFFQNFRHRIVIGRSRDTTDIIKRTHQSRCTRFHAHFIREQISIPKSLSRDLGINIITSGFGSAITDIMFQTSRYTVFGRHIISLITTHRCSSKYPIRIRVFTVSFGNTSPAGIARYVNHR